jgi:hypothetical protein
MIQKEMVEETLQLWGSRGIPVLGCQNKAIGIAVNGQNAAGILASIDPTRCIQEEIPGHFFQWPDSKLLTSCSPTESTG